MAKTKKSLLSTKSGERNMAKKAARKRQKLNEKAETADLNSVASTNQFGAANKLIFICVRILHFIDFAVGVILLGYGLTLKIDGKHPQIGACIIAFSALLVTSSTLAFYGFKSPFCERIGLRLSAFMGICLGLVDLTLAGSVYINNLQIIAFLREHHTDFFLTNSDVDGMEHARNAIATLFLLVGAGEFVRFFALEKLRKDLVSIENIAGIVRGSEDVLSEPLLDDEALDSDTDSDFAPVDGQLYTDGNWWADKNQNQESKSESEGKKKEESWMNKATTAEDSAV